MVVTVLAANRNARLAEAGYVMGRMVVGVQLGVNFLIYTSIEAGLFMLGCQKVQL